MVTNTPAEAATPQPATATEENVAGEEVSSTAAAAGSTTTAPKEGAAAATPKLIESVDQPRFSEAVDVEGYEKRKRDALKQVPSLEESAAAHEVEAAQPPVTSDEPEVTSPEGEPPATTAEGEGEPSPADTEPPVTTEPGKVPDRVRIGRLNDKDKTRVANAVQIAADEGIPFEEALARVTGKPRAKTDDEIAAEAQPPAEEFTGLRTREQIEADMAALDAEYESAGKDLDTSRMAGELRKRERDLDRELAQCERAEIEAKARQERHFEQSVKASNAEAVKFYPDSGKKDTPLYNKITEIAGRLEASKNPLIYQADAPMRVAQMAANELGIAPADPKKTVVAKTPAAKPTTSTATRPAPVNQTAVSRSPQPAATPASGAARTNHGNGAAPVAFEKIKTVQDYEELKEKLLQPA